jgi:hypothetical protein
MHRRGRLDGDESYQRHLCGIADKRYDLHAELHRCRRHVLNGQYDGGGPGESGSGQRRVRIGERHDGIGCTVDQSLLSWHILVRGRRGPVDMELRWFQRRHRRELLRIYFFVWVFFVRVFNTNSCCRKLRYAAGRQSHLLRYVRH